MQKFVALILFSVMFAGCSSEAKQPTESTPNKNTVTAGKNTNTVVLGNSDQPAILDAEPSNKLTPTKQDIIAKLRQKNLAAANTPASGPPPPPQYRPAPDDSVVATAMNSKGSVVETRIYKNHPNLSRVELKWVSPDDKRVKIYLRNGKVVEKKAANIDNLGTTPTSVLLQMAGIGAAK